MEELEIIHRWVVPGIRLFLNTVEYRTAHFHSDWKMLWILENPLLQNAVFLRKQSFTEVINSGRNRKTCDFSR